MPFNRIFKKKKEESKNLKNKQSKGLGRRIVKGNNQNPIGNVFYTGEYAYAIIETETGEIIDKFRFKLSAENLLKKYKKIYVKPDAVKVIKLIKKKYE